MFIVIIVGTCRQIHYRWVERLHLIIFHNRKDEKKFLKKITIENKKKASSKIRID